jgi:long-chain-fatty-acid---luciferin-component ligase
MTTSVDLLRPGKPGPVVPTPRASDRAAEPAPAAERTSNLKSDVIDASTPLDSLIFSEDPWYDLPLGEQAALTADLVQGALEFHLANCAPYAAYFERCGPRESRPQPADVPLISTRLFKHAEIRSVPAREIEQWYVSSGTNGPRSRVGRDRTSLERLIGSVRASLGLVGEWHEEEMTLINLGPGREDTGNVWFQYVMSLVELMYATHSVVRDGVLRAEGVTDLLVGLLAGGEHVGIIGPPFLVYELCRSIEGRGVAVEGGGRLTVITAGGWKRHAGVMPPRPEFERLVARSLRLERADQMRDAFNQVELNTVFFECAAHEKHVPPWVFAAARDPRSLGALPPGREGLLSYVDASSKSYPSFLVADDVGVVRVGACACGREGTRVEVIRRLDTRAQKGCALAMDKGHE